MRATHALPERRLTRIHWPRRHTGFMTPLPPRRNRVRREPLEIGNTLEPWRGRDIHPEIHGPLRQIAWLILWLLVVTAMILLFAEFWP